VGNEEKLETLESIKECSGLATRTKMSISMKFAILATFSFPITKVKDFFPAALINSFSLSTISMYPSTSVHQSK